MRAPEKKEDYEVFDADGIRVFLSRKVLSHLPGRVRSLRFQIQGYGHFRIELDRDRPNRTGRGPDPGE